MRIIKDTFFVYLMYYTFIIMNSFLLVCYVLQEADYGFDYFFGWFQEIYGASSTVQGIS